jgi:hypothetical protein
MTAGDKAEMRIDASLHISIDNPAIGICCSSACSQSGEADGYGADQNTSGVIPPLAS